MRVCGACQSEVEDQARFCDRCGAPVGSAVLPPPPTGPSGTAAQSPPVASPWSSPRPRSKEVYFKRPPGYRDHRRTVASAILAAGFVLAAVALGLGWWTVSASTPGLSYSWSVLPGGSVGVSCSGSSTTCSYLSAFSVAGSPLGSLYVDIGDLVAAAVVLALVATVLGFLGAYGMNFGRPQMTLILLFGVLSFVLLIAAVAWAAAGTGSAASSGSSGAYGSGTVYFWGVNGTASWGAGAGWYVAVVAFILLLVGARRYASTRKEAFTALELGYRPPATEPSVPSPWPTAAGAAPWSGGGPGTATPASAGSSSFSCPQCRAFNQTGAVNCWHCGLTFGAVPRS